MNKYGRPKKNEEDKRNIGIHIRLTKEEREMFRKVVEQEHSKSLTACIINLMKERNEQYESNQTIG